MVADVNTMFHKVKAQKAGFLWAEEIIPNAKSHAYQMILHIFETTDWPCCANYALKSVARNNFSKFNYVTITSNNNEVFKPIPEPKR